jgi:hypothetical protein
MPHFLRIEICSIASISLHVNEQARRHSACRRQRRTPQARTRQSLQSLLRRPAKCESVRGLGTHYWLPALPATSTTGYQPAAPFQTQICRLNVHPSAPQSLQVARVGAAWRTVTFRSAAPDPKGCRGQPLGSCWSEPASSVRSHRIGSG